MLAGDPARRRACLLRRAYQALEALGEKANLSTIAAYSSLKPCMRRGEYDEAEQTDEVLVKA